MRQSKHRQQGATGGRVRRIPSLSDDLAMVRGVRRQGLGARNDPREVVPDPHARYFGAELGERSLIPAGDARLGEIRFQEWLNQSAVQR